MVTLTVLLALLLFVAVVVVIGQSLALRHSHERVHSLLAENEELARAIKATGQVLNLAMKQNHQLRREIDCHLTSLEMVLEQLP